jgi:hypothetical protein
VRERQASVRDTGHSVRGTGENYKSQAATLCLGSVLEDWKED